MRKTQFFSLLMFTGISLHGQNTEKWFISTMAGTAVGYVAENTKTQDGLTASGTSMKFVFNRKNSKIEMLLKSEITENEKGEFLSARGTVKTTGQDISLEGVLKGDSIHITTSTGGQIYKTKIAVKEKLDGPGAIRKKSMAMLKHPGDSIHYTAFSPDLGIVVHVTRKLLSTEAVTLGGAKLPVHRITDIYKESPYARVLFVDDAYHPVKTIDPSPFGNIESTLTTRHIAEQAGENTLLPADSWEKTVIASNVRFTDPRNLEQLTCKVTLKNSSFEFPDLNTWNQKVLEQGKNYAVIQYSRVVDAPKAQEAKADDLTDYLSPNSLINSDDPEIIKIANSVASGKKNNFAKAVALKNWVSANVEVDLGVVAAPGSEVCRTRKGTCVAFSTFFASLLRAAGVPARYIGGYVYMNGIWGGHAWVEIYHHGTWIPMDATINTTDIADAARISFGNGWSLKNGMAEFAASRGSILFGNADIKVLSYTVNGKKVSVPETEKPYTLKGNVYHNPGKKIQITGTGDFEFGNLDELWPSKSFATVRFKEGHVKMMEGYWMAPGTKEQAIKSEIESVSKSKLESVSDFNGSKIYTMTDKTKAFYTVIRGKDLLLFYANGTNPAGMLKQLLTVTKFEE
ncbi:MAG: transglutaminase domain-containing protein [Chitinophagales bacterium]|nr:transglutaminase domain-containing protein [Chitinophagales bacterium]